MVPHPDAPRCDPASRVPVQGRNLEEETPSLVSRRSPSRCSPARRHLPSPPAVAAASATLAVRGGDFCWSSGIPRTMLDVLRWAAEPFRKMFVLLLDLTDMHLLLLDSQMRLGRQNPTAILHHHHPAAAR